MAMDYNWFCAHILSIMMDVLTNISRRLQYRKLEWPIRFSNGITLTHVICNVLTMA